MALPDPMEAFVWGAGGSQRTPEQIARDREVAAALMQQGLDFSPIASPWQGAARVANAAAGAFKNWRDDKAETANAATNQSLVQALLGGGSEQFPSAPSMGNATADAPQIPQTAEAGAIRDGLISRGLPPHVADAFVLNFQDESGLNPGINEKNPTVPGSRGGFGLYQLTGPRRKAYEAFAGQRGVDPSDTNAQLDFLMSELQGPESRAAQSILSAPDTGTAAAAIVNDFLRPAPEYRASRANRYMGLAGQGSQAPAVAALDNLAAGQPVQVASTDPSIGMGSPISTVTPVPADKVNPQAGQPLATDAPTQRIMGAMMNPQPMGGQYQGIEPSMRPFRANERRPNPDGSYSTEISTTQQQPDGQFVNIPSLWMGKQGSVQFSPSDEDGIMSEAQRYEAQNGPTFARFPDVQSAEKAAVARSAAGGAGAGPQGAGTPGEIRKGADGKTYQYAQTTGMMGATGDWGWIPVNVDGQSPAITASTQVAQALSGTDMSRVPVTAGGDAGVYQPGQGASMQAIVQALSSPYADEQTKRIAGLLLGQQMEQQQQANDPLRQLQIEKARREMQMGQPLINAGGGAIYNPNTGEWLTAPGGGQAELPSRVREYEYAKQQGFAGTFNDWLASQKGGMALSVDPATGAVTFQQGGNIKPMTEAQSKDTTFAVRAQGALPILDKFGNALTSLPESAAGSLPGGVGNYMQSPEYQQAQQAGTEFLQAILRKDTGAAITPQETAEYGKVYLPRPGDSPEVLAQKQVSRSRALEALKAGMTPQAILAQEKALGNVDAGAKKITTPDGYTIEEVQ